MKASAFVATLTLLFTFAGCRTFPGARWSDKLAEELPALGHRNWILVVDSAYPAQSRTGIETVATGADHIEVVKTVLTAVDNAEHVRAKVYLDEEIKYVSQKDAPGIDAYRERLTALLAGRTVEYVAHEDLIARVDEDAKTFQVLVLKTALTLPYTSVFLKLDCGYWSPQKEQKLRRAMQKMSTPH